MSEDAPNLHPESFVAFSTYSCTQCEKAQKWAFYAGCAASFTLGLLGGICAVALAWSHLGG